jgi:hypothetical protein
MEVEGRRPVNDEKEYLLFCDESGRRGEYFSNFYGACWW